MNLDEFMTALIAQLATTYSIATDAITWKPKTYPSHDIQGVVVTSQWGKERIVSVELPIITMDSAGVEVCVSRVTKRVQP